MEVATAIRKWVLSLTAIAVMAVVVEDRVGAEMKRESDWRSEAWTLEGAVFPLWAEFRPPCFRLGRRRFECARV